MMRQQFNSSQDSQDSQIRNNQDNKNENHYSPKDEQIENMWLEMLALNKKEQAILENTKIKVAEQEIEQAKYDELALVAKDKFDSAITGLEV